MKTIHKTEILQAETSTGKDKFWQGFSAIDENGDAVTYTESWQTKADGEKGSVLISTPKIIKGKNIGRANETSPEQQAWLEITSQANKKKDKGYAPEGEEADILPLPMLAHSYWKRCHNVDWDDDVYVQPKLDGTRMLFDGKKGWSRQGKLYLSEVIAHLQCELPEGIILDGELMIPGATFQESIRAIKKYRKGVTSTLVFHVYDIASVGAPFSVRTISVAKLFYSEKWNLWNKNGFDIVFTHKINSEADIHTYHDKFVNQGHEGIMIRHGKDEYKYGHRSVSLLKLKNFLDEEFEITAIGEGSGKEKGCAIFTCKTENNQTFNVRPQGTLEERQAYFNKGSALIGETLTVRFQELTDDGIPRFPVGVAIRNYEGAITYKPA